MNYFLYKTKGSNNNKPNMVFTRK